MIALTKLFNKINFNGGNISCDGGILLLLKFMEYFNLLHFIKEIPFKDSRRNPRFSNPEIFKQLIIRNLLGYFNQADQQVLIDDPLLSKLSVACSQSTLSRFFNRVSIETNTFLRETIQKMGCNYVNKHVDHLILDVDSTKTETYGHQEGSAFIYHYSTCGYHPILINESNTKLLLNADLRSGSSYSSNGFINLMDEVLAHLKVENKTVQLRADSAFYNGEYLDYMNDKNITYYVRAKNYNKAHNIILNQLLDQGINFENYTSSSPYYGEIEYKISNMKSSCRYIYKVYSATDKQMELIPVIYCIITNDTKKTPEDICNFYEERGNSENFTKELKDDFDASNVGHYDFEKNCLQFMLSALCYNIFHIFQQEILEGKDKTIRMNTYRMKYQKIGVKVIQHARQCQLSFSSAYRYQNKFMKYYKKIQV